MLKSRSHSRLGSRRQPEESRAAILRAAVEEFSREGIAGARTDAIARAAHVNKALLYYYFRDKEALYSAVLDQVFTGLNQSVLGVFARDLPPRQKILAYAGAHFDYIASHPLYPPIVQAEMMRAVHGRSVVLERVAHKYFQPLFAKLAELLRQGMASGDFRVVDPWHFVPSMISIITFHFTNAPVMRILMRADPHSPELLTARRAAILDLLSAALFRGPAPKPQGVSR